jgi:ribosome recycling factor
MAGLTALEKIMRLLVTKMANGYFMSENYRIEDVLRDIYKELKDINNRLSIIETQMDDANKRVNAHDDQIRHVNEEVGTLWKEVGILQGSWKTYLAIGGIAGTLGAVVGALIK